MKKKQYAIALCRVSSDEQLKNNSLNRQNKAVQRIANEHGAEIIRTWSGSVSSKRGNNVKRKDLQEMLNFCRNNKRVKYLIVDEPDRFMRSMQEASYFEVRFGELGVELLYSDPQLNVDSSVARLQRMLSYFGAENSNEERIRKSIKGCEAAIKEGRYPFPIKLGYKKGTIAGVAVIDPEIGPLLREQLLKIAKRLSSPTIALRDFNRAIELASIKKAPLKMDKWRSICTDPYYCGTVEMHKAVNVSNPNGLHEKLISRDDHNKIIEVFERRPKCQLGPNNTGNPLYPFNKMVVHADCPMTKSSHNIFVGCTVRNNSGKRYEKYRCRGCYMYMNRDEMHEKIGQEYSHLELTESGKKALDDAITEAFDMHDESIQARLTKLHSQKKAVNHRAEELLYACSKEPDGPLKDGMRSEYEKLVKRIKQYEDEIQEVGDKGARAYEAFCFFAINFVNNLVHKVLELSPRDMQLCKQLLFPNGFFVSDDRNVYTHRFSPIYRWAETKNDSFESENSLMVRVKRL